MDDILLSLLNDGKIYQQRLMLARRDGAAVSIARDWLKLAAGEAAKPCHARKRSAVELLSIASELADRTAANIAEMVGL